MHTTVGNRLKHSGCIFNREKEVIDGVTAKACVDAEMEWLCEAYMKTDYSQLTQEDFQATLNDYLAYLVKEGKVYEP